MFIVYELELSEHRMDDEYFVVNTTILKMEKSKQFAIDFLYNHINKQMQHFTRQQLESNFYNNDSLSFMNYIYKISEV